MAHHLASTTDKLVKKDNCIVQPSNLGLILKLIQPLINFNERIELEPGMPAHMNIPSIPDAEEGRVLKV